MTIEKSFKAYRKCLEKLDAENLDELQHHVTRDVYFEDPFYSVHGVGKMQEVFSVLFNQVEDIEFTIVDYVASERAVYFSWTLLGILNGKEWFVKGVTHLIFNREDKVVRHVEYWDAATQFYERLPLIGLIIRYIKNIILRRHKTIN